MQRWPLRNVPCAERLDETVFHHIVDRLLITELTTKLIYVQPNHAFERNGIPASLARWVDRL